PSPALMSPPSTDAPRALLAAQSQTLRIVQRLQPHGRGAHLAEDIDLEARAFARELGRHVPGGEAAVDAMAVGAGSHVADRGALLHEIGRASCREGEECWG